ncbi:MAG: hypothetical protein FWD65_02875 [Coriobacteriia bacterium]|nr:hypothetical protein [Coriobacteriia bacterium]
MKQTKMVTAILLFLMLLFLVSACQHLPSGSSGTSSSNKKLSSDTNVMPSNIGMTPGDNYYEENAKWFKNNPIDKAYLAEAQPDTTYGNAELEMKYLTIWQNEVAFSASNFRKRLDASDAAAFDRQQKLWEEWANGSIDFDHDIMNHGKYGIDMGTSRQFIYTDAKMNIWRDRDMHLKYLTSYLEYYCDNPLPENQWTWNKFNYP